MSVRFPAAGQPHWRRHSLVSDCPNSLLALSLPLKPPRSPVISDIPFEKRSRVLDNLAGALASLGKWSFSFIKSARTGALLSLYH